MRIATIVVQGNVRVSVDQNCKAEKRTPTGMAAHPDCHIRTIGN
jgi:hypothetical protein